jgi:predicted small secreted protein
MAWLRAAELSAKLGVTIKDLSQSVLQQSIKRKEEVHTKISKSAKRKRGALEGTEAHHAAQKHSIHHREGPIERSFSAYKRWQLRMVRDVTLASIKTF